MTLSVEGKAPVKKWNRGDAQFIGRGVKHESQNASGKPIDFVIVAAPNHLHYAVAKTFLDVIEAPFAPEEFKDAYREELQTMISRKAAQSDVATASTATKAAPAGAKIVKRGS